MTRKRITALLMVLVLAVCLLPGTARAKSNEKRVAEDMDFAEILEDTSEKGTVNVYHWWTAGGEKDAIESVVDGFEDVYAKVRAKSNAIPGGAGGAMVMKVKVLQQA